MKESPPGLALRIAVLVAGICGVCGILTAGLISAPVAVGLATLLVTAASAATAGLSRRYRDVAAAGTFLLVGGAAVATSGLGTGVVGALAIVAAGLLVAQQTLADSLRELAVTTAVGLALLLLALGLAPAPLLSVPLVIGWVAGVTVATLVNAAHRGTPGAGDDQADRTVSAVVRAGGPAPTSTSATVAVLASVSTVLAVLAVLVFPTPDGSAARRRLGDLGRLGAGEGRQLGAYAGQDLDLRVRGRLPESEVAQVPLDAPRLWRVAVLADYDGVTWSAGAQTPVSPTDLGRGAFDVRPSMDDGVRQRGSEPKVDRRDDVRLARGSLGLVMAPGHPATVAVPAGGVRSFGAGRLLIGGGPAGAAPDRYTVTSGTVPDAADLAGPAGPAASDPARPGWTALPPSVTRRTRDLAARVTAGSSSRGEQVAAIERYLARTYPYRLDSPRPPDGQDAVDHFLFDAREGFCEQFAAAEVVMLRSVGVPARMATGFSGGSPDGPTRQLRGTDAHAWVEVYQPGTGWAPSDPTPPSVTSGGSSVLVVLVRRLLADQQQRLVAALGLGVLAALILGGAARRRRRGGPPPGRGGPAANGREPARPGRPAWLVVDTLTRLVATLGEVGRGSPPEETLAELARRVPEVPADAFAVAERALYARRPPPQHDVEEAVRRVEAGRRAVLASVSAPAPVTAPAPPR
jgi:protein-glutamine gamma-glutamyltransferase